MGNITHYAQFFSHSVGVCLLNYFHLFFVLLFWLFVLLSIALLGRRVFNLFSLSISPLHFVILLAIHMAGILFLPLFKDFLTFQYQGIGHMTNGIFHVLGLGIFHSPYDQLHDIGMHLGLVCKCSAFTIHLLLTYKKKVRIFWYTSPPGIEPRTVWVKHIV